ncbi:type II secretion system protein GspD [Aquimarina sp. 2201CG14-23]|uniref:type II secretion system protein GspD n=1 Tax=Aquimarina mycalae TaxID=3040073 RepID=UPI002477DBD8|nr:type II and III secretion system protein [Aquimarina sp. 2201CG14-23]MDH7445308.1 type II and III secretion system protein [Aquimarina sp. 2201CG14-23]
MKKNILLICFIFNFGILSFAQDNFQNQSEDNTRIGTIQNKLQLLSVEVPGLAEKVNISISNTTLLNFLRAVSQVHKININPSDQLNSVNIINGFNDVTVQDLLIFLVKEYNLDIKFTGNILSIKKYVPPTEIPVEKELIIDYDLTAGTLSTDLRNDPLPKVFRKITEASGKNLLYTPELNTKNLTLYLSNVPIDVALQKLAETNDLDFNKTRDGFYEFESIPGVNNTSGGSGSARRRRGNSNYKIVDTLNRVLSVDLRNANVSELINNVSEDLKLNIFTASPLEDAGQVTVKAEAISFDDLLVKIFESNSKNVAQNTASNSQSNRNNTTNQQGGFQNKNAATSSNFTFKKEGNVYYFGTENQLTIKKIEMVQMMHRSIAMLGDANPSGGLGGNSFGNNNFVTGGTNFFGNQGNSNFNQNRTNTRNQGNINSGISRNSSSNSGNSTQAGSISDIFPASITEGLDIKIDTELNSFVVSGSGTRVEKFKNFVKYIDKPVPLILIEVMILEVSRSATVETGIEFGLGKEPTTAEGVSFPNANITLGSQTINRIIGGFDGFGSLNLGNVVPNFYMDIKAMESNGNVKILSTPKLSTLNGHKAYLSSGQTTYYAVTSQNIFGSQNPQTSEIVNYQPIDAELALEFKPFVSGDGQITLDIQVIQSNFSGERIAEDAPPDINSRRFSSIMRMQANDVAILGGIEEKVKNDSGSGVPLLSRIPIIKWLFSKRRREDSKKKLNVIIKPTVFY